LSPSHQQASFWSDQSSSYRVVPSCRVASVPEILSVIPNSQTGRNLDKKPHRLTNGLSSSQISISISP
jgi:hypothetical protein